MRLPAVLMAALILASCAKKEEAAPPAEIPVETAPTIDMTTVAGSWDLQIVGMGSDSVLTTGTLVATVTDSGWVMSLPNRDPMALQVTIAGDSIITVAPEYESVLRKGVRVQTTGVYRMVGSNLNGITTATYRGVGADSVVMLRSIGTRKTM